MRLQDFYLEKSDLAEIRLLQSRIRSRAREIPIPLYSAPGDEGRFWQFLHFSRGGRSDMDVQELAVRSSCLWCAHDLKPMTTVRNPKTMKSYHSSAFPTTAAATWIGFGGND